MNPTTAATADLELIAPLVDELPARLDPFEVLRSLAFLPHAALLDSAMRHPQLGRYSYVTADPFEWLKTRRHERPDPLDWLERQLARYALPSIPDLPPFQGGALGLFGYDLCHDLERLPRPAIDDFQTPDVAVGLYDWVIAFDHVRQRNWLISTGWPADTPAQRRHRAVERLARVRQLLDAPGASAPTFRRWPGPPANGADAQTGRLGWSGVQQFRAGSISGGGSQGDRLHPCWGLFSGQHRSAIAV